MEPRHDSIDNLDNFASLEHELLLAISHAQGQFIVDADPRDLFDKLLDELLKLTDSEYGFIGEVLYVDDGTPFLKTGSRRRKRSLPSMSVLSLSVRAPARL